MPAGELPGVEPTAFAPGTSTAVAMQEPWVLSGTLRENITLRAPRFDGARYAAVVRACMLEDDIARMPFGDATVVGERGIALSGGQRARLGLARMAYRRADAYLIDDPLSAVDPHVGAQVFERLICGVLKGSLRLLVTHQMQYLAHAAVSRVIVLRSGAVVADAPLAALNPALPELDGIREAASHAAAAEPAAAMERRQRGGDRHGEGLEDASIVSQVKRAATAEEAAGRRRGGGEEGGAAAPEPSQLVVSEEREVGSVTWRTYRTWAGAAGWRAALPAVCLMVGGQACATASLLYLPYWGSLPAEEQAAPRHSWLCAGLLLAAVLFAVVRSQLFFHIAVTASDKLHRCALQRLLRAPMVFYDSNPSGRLLNRFSKDIEFCDSMLPQTFHDTMQCVLMVTASVGLCIALAPWALIALPPLLCYFRWHLEA